MSTIPRLIPLLLLLLPLLCGFEDFATVRRVVDGDTITLASDESVRLASIDAPEIGRDGAPDGLGAREAKAFLTHLLAAGKVRIVPVGPDRDRYGRITALVFLPDGRLVNDVLLREGHAFFYPHPDLPSPLAGPFSAAQAEALRQGRGLWPALSRTAAASGSYVGNRRSLRFFPATCPEAAAVSPHNRIFFGSLRDAFDAGFAPARICPFWPSASEGRR